MKKCAEKNTKLKLSDQLVFDFSEKNIKISGVNYIDHCKYTIYKDWEDFKSKNNGDFYYLTRYGKKPHTSFDYSDNTKNIYTEKLASTTKHDDPDSEKPYYNQAATQDKGRIKKMPPLLLF